MTESKSDHSSVSHDVKAAAAASSAFDEPAFDVWENAASSGDAASLAVLGRMLQRGRGCQVDLARAVQCFRDADKQGLPSAARELGHCYEQVRRTLAAASR